MRYYILHLFIYQLVRRRVQVLFWHQTKNQKPASAGFLCLRFRNLLSKIVFAHAAQIDIHLDNQQLSSLQLLQLSRMLDASLLFLLL